LDSGTTAQCEVFELRRLEITLLTYLIMRHEFTAQRSLWCTICISTLYRHH